MPQNSDRFTAEAHARTTYDSNLAAGNTAVSSVRQIDPEDVTYTLGGSVILQLPSAKQTIFVRGGADILRHDKNDNLDSESLAAALGYLRRIGPCGLMAQATYDRRQALLQDLTVAVSKNTIEVQSATGGLTCGRRGINGGLQGNISQSRNTATGSGFVDSQTVGATLSVGYQNARLGNVGAFARYGEVTYERALVPTALQPNGFESYGAGFSYSRAIGQRINGAASIAYMIQKPQGTVLTLGTLKTSKNISADVNMNYEASRRTRFSVAYSLSNQASSTVNADYVRSQLVRASVDYTLNPRITLRAGASASRDNYRGGLNLPLQIRKNEQVLVFGGGRLKIGRKIEMSLDVTHTDRNADVNQFDYNSNRVTLGVTSTF